MRNTLIITLAAVAALALAPRANAEGFKLDAYSVGGAAVGFAVGGPLGAGAGWYAGNKMGEHEKAQDSNIRGCREDVDTLGNYVASQPWKAKIKAMQSEEPAAQDVQPKAQPKQVDWRKACIPQGTGGLDMAVN